MVGWVLPVSAILCQKSYNQVCYATISQQIIYKFLFWICQSGCKWRFDWFKGADNPAMEFKRVKCPKEILQVSHCEREDEWTQYWSFFNISNEIKSILYHSNTLLITIFSEFSELFTVYHNLLFISSWTKH